MQSVDEFEPFELIQNDNYNNPFNQINYKNNQKRHKLYFSLYSSTTSKSSTDKNKYTGIYKDYNLIYIVAESFSEIAVSEELTPTLYKLTLTLNFKHRTNHG